MRVFMYLRYSSTNQKGGVSIKVQRETIQTFLSATRELNGVSRVEKIDEAKTGTSFACRTAFNEIHQEAGQGDAVVVYKYDRLGRNLLESLQNIKRLEQDRAIRVYSATEPNTEVVRNLLLTMAEEFSRQLGERCKRALDSLAKEGYATNKAPYGYRLDKEGRRTGAKYKVVPDQADNVERIFKLRASGYSHRAIAKVLNDEGIPSPMGRRWTVSAVHTILRHEAYLGKIVAGIRQFKKGYRGPGNGRKRPPQDWVTNEEAHEPIISRQLWDAVRALDSDRCADAGGAPRTRRKYLWSGFLKCGACGSNLSRLKCVGDVYYGCDSHRRHGEQLPCHNRYLVRLSELNQVVGEVFKSRLYSPKFVNKVIRRARVDISRAIESNSQVLQPMEEALKRVAREYENAARNLARAPEDLYPVFLEEVSKLKSERDSLRVKIEGVRGMQGKCIDLADVDAIVRNKLEDLWSAFHGDTGAAARNLLGQHLEKVVIHPDRQAELVPSSRGLMAQLEVVSDIEDVQQETLAEVGKGYVGNVGIPTGI